MDSNKELKYFKAVTYDKNEYHFAVTPEGKIYCIEFGMDIPADRVEIKPNFTLRKESGSTLCTLDDYLRSKNQKQPNYSGHLIYKWDIEPELLNYLIENKKITYSTFVAELYGFDPQYAIDARHQTRFFKKTRNNPEEKARILLPIKSGKFH